MAYGVGVSAWRGVSVVKSPALPLVRTPISSQRELPSKTPPKSSVTVNKPLLMEVAELVSVAPSCVLPDIES